MMRLASYVWRQCWIWGGHCWAREKLFITVERNGIDVGLIDFGPKLVPPCLGELLDCGEFRVCEICGKKEAVE